MQDRVFLEGAYPERDYASRRASAFVVAADCGTPGGTCFCVSMGTGPRAGEGFDIALEITVKAHRAGYRITEIPTVWRDRTAGASNFQLARWLPRYLRWYGLALRGGARGRNGALRAAL